MESLTIAEGENIALNSQLDKRSILYELEQNIRLFNKNSQKKVKLGCRSLAQELIRLATNQWNKSSPLERQEGFKVETRTKSLAKTLGCTARTIRNYYPILLNSGIIEERKNIRGIVSVRLSWKFVDESLQLAKRKILPPLVPELQEHFRLNNSAPLGQVDILDEKIQEQNVLEANSRALSTTDGLEGKEEPTQEQMGLGEKCWQHINRKIYLGIYDFGHKNRDWAAVCAELISFEASRSGISIHDAYFNLRRWIDIAAEWIERNPKVSPPPPSFYLAKFDDGFRLLSVKKWDNSLRTMNYATNIRFKILNMAKVFRKGKSPYSMLELNNIFIKDVERYPILKPWYLQNSFNLFVNG